MRRLHDTVDARTQPLDEWFLEGFDPTNGAARCVPVSPLPFTVGRGHDQTLRLGSQNVSQRHAELFDRDGRLWLRDLESTNGTFINRERLNGERALAEGDIVHFANLEFRLTSSQKEPTGESTQVQHLSPDLLSQRFAMGSALKELIDGRTLRCVYQPIVRLDNLAVFAYEGLVRGDHPQLDRSPVELLYLAQSLGLSRELSHTCRDALVSAYETWQSNATLFINLHPSEFEDSAGALESLSAYRHNGVAFPIVVELHEDAVTDLESMRWFREKLNDLDIKLAFDDFGEGKSRLTELVEVRPDYLKFDIGFVRGLNHASADRRRMVSTLVKLTRELGIVTVAEGVETAEELRACREAGFELGQGFLLGLPTAQQRR